MALRRAAALQEADPALAGTGRLMLGVVREMRLSFERSLAPLGITAQQAELLHRIHRDADTNPRDLTYLLMTDKAGVSRLVDRLAAKGLIARAVRPEDRRSLRIRLTPKGRALIPKVARVAERHKRVLFAGLTATEETRLSQLLRRVLVRARELNP